MPVKIPVSEPKNNEERRHETFSTQVLMSHVNTHSELREEKIPADSVEDADAEV